MAILQGNAKQGSTRGFYPKTINRSLRFNDDDSAYLSWTPASAGNRKTWTWSSWVKRADSGDGTGANHHFLFSASTTQCDFYQNGFRFYIDGGTYIVVASQKLRDYSSWYHIVVSVDTTQATASDRIKIYINGELLTAYTTTAYPPQNTDTAISSTSTHYIGKNASTNYLHAYLADVYFIDGQALSADDFGETKNGVWVAKDYAGTFGTNGFHLTFEDDTEVEAFNTVLYRGSGSQQSITGMGFKPDLVWIKCRDNTRGHILNDSVRGAGKVLRTNGTGAEDTSASAQQTVTSFDSDGFTIGTDSDVSTSSENFVAWCWKAGDSNVSNTDGSITSTVRANDTYGFSIVSWAATGTPSDTIGHGLSSTPDMIIVKDRDAVSDWCVYTQTTGAGAFLKLNDTAASTANTTMWNNTSPTSSVFNWGYSGGNDIIAYCWAEKTGYSKFGSWVGTGAPQTITTGFKPAMIIWKRTDSTSDWSILDNTRDTDGEMDTYLYPNASNADGTPSNYGIEVLSDGFKLTGTGTAYNGSGVDVIYAAFADTREAAFWLDQSGNDNDWQPVNLDHNDTVADSPTDNFCTLNPLDKTGGTLSDGNLAWEATGSNSMIRSTMAMTSGKWYAEITAHTAPYFQGFGVHKANASLASGSRGGLDSDSWTYEANGAATHNNVQTALGAFSANDTVMIAVDIDAGKLWFGVNGTWKNSGDPSAGTNAIYTNLGGEPMQFVSGDYYFEKATWNFGQQPFKYDPPE